MLVSKKRSGGRNNQGRMTMKFRGGGHKKQYRLIDFKRDRFNDEAEVLTIEYDPNRSAFIALTKFNDGEKDTSLLSKDLKLETKLFQVKKLNQRLVIQCPFHQFHLVLQFLVLS